jgi:very-short-patch-repair endonuclease
MWWWGFLFSCYEAHMIPPSLPRKTALARHMRKRLTGPEYLLWERLKLRLDDGLVFKRQHAFGAYILDFYCFKARLVIEVDGAVHGEEARAQKDAIREMWLHAQGLEVYRLPASEVYRDPDAAADGVKLLAFERAAERQ